MIDERDLETAKEDVKEWVKSNFVPNSKCETVQEKTNGTIQEMKTAVAVISSDLKSIKWLMTAGLGAVIVNIVGSIFDRLVS